MCRNYYFVCDFDISKYDKTIKSEKKIIVLTEERMEHIKNRHPEVVPHIKMLDKIFNNPDFIL